MRKAILAATAALCLAAPVLAFGNGTHETHALDHVTCGDGTTLTPPLASPLCAGHNEVASVTCATGAVLTPPLAGKICPADGGTEPTSGNHEGHGQHKPAGDGDEGPRFSAGFLNRVWRISGEANGFENGVLDFTAGDFLHIPRRFKKQDDPLVGVDSRVLVSDHTRVYDADHHRVAPGDVASDLDNADTVIVTAKLLPKAKWQQDLDGTPVPTLRAKRITITS